MFKTTVGIDGMACSMCESHVNDAIRRNINVKSVKSSHTKNVTEIISEEPVSEESLHAALDPTGYRVVSFASEPYEKKKGLFRR